MILLYALYHGKNWANNGGKGPYASYIFFVGHWHEACEVLNN